MAMITLKDSLKIAKDHKFAVGAFNAIDSHFIDAIFSSAEELQSPVILNVAEVHLKHINIEDISTYIKYKAKKTSIPVTLNLDHGFSFDTIKKAIECGFTSIMFDGSHLSYERNIEMTQSIVQYCRGFGVSVEAELGAVGGDEGGDLHGSADEALYTRVEQAEEFVRLTGIDALAVAIGNSHGNYKGTPKLDFERLIDINSVAGIPLVLHGGSGLSVQDFKSAINYGICKVNFYTGMSQAAIASIARNISNPEFMKKYDHYLIMMLQAQREISSSVTAQMRIYSSEHKANLYE
ncbi:ketose 1,6-bisphosphate aldolase [Aeromonas allosaccharophila]|uniref:ketose 1,6-bisphosphate aldolase n=1 Tax=Aeromonas allosaccharophila TaxID=656 RepID=UPI0035B85830